MVGFVATRQPPSPRLRRPGECRVPFVGCGGGIRSCEGSGVDVDYL